MSTPNIRTPYTRVRQVAGIPSDSKTVKDAGNDTDVNNIVARFARTGELPPATREPQYGDVTAMQGDLTEIIAKGQAAQKALDDLQLAKTVENAKIAEENAKKLKEYEELRAKQQQNQQPTTEEK